MNSSEVIEVIPDPKPTESIRVSRLVQQGPWWARVKSRQGWTALAFDTETILPHFSPESTTSSSSFDNCFYSGPEDLLVLCREISPEKSIAYVPYGPRYLPDAERRGAYLESLSENLRPLLPAGCLFIRYDLPWESPWVRDENRFSEDGEWLGPPTVETREIRMNFNTRFHKLRKAPGENLPTHTLLVDLEQEPERILSRMKSKTRYNIRLAGRKGIVTREVGREMLPSWLDLYRQTVDRNGITPHGPEYFVSAIENSVEGQEIKLLLSFAGRDPVAGMFLVFSGGRATYLYGASSMKNRNLMGTYALQWKAMEMARQKGCIEYDMFGISPDASPSHPLYGLYRFKKGFGGNILHRQGCWDYPFDEDAYQPYRSFELNGPAYHTGRT